MNNYTEIKQAWQVSMANQQDMTKQRKDLVIKLSSMNLLDTYTHMYTLNGMAI